MSVSLPGLLPLPLLPRRTSLDSRVLRCIMVIDEYSRRLRCSSGLSPDGEFGPDLFARARLRHAEFHSIIDPKFT